MSAEMQYSSGGRRQLSVCCSARYTFLLTSCGGFSRSSDGVYENLAPEQATSFIRQEILLCWICVMFGLSI